MKRVKRVKDLTGLLPRMQTKFFTEGDAPPESITDCPSWIIETDGQVSGAVWIEQSNNNQAHVVLFGGMLGNAEALNSIFDEVGPTWLALPIYKKGVIKYLSRYIGFDFTDTIDYANVTWAIMERT